MVPGAATEFFVNYGEGYHSNDARVAVVPGSSPLVRSKGYEVGVRSKPWGPDGVELITTPWQLDLQSELVFVGDEGTTEIRGPSRRRGVEVAARGNIFGPLYFNGSVTYTKAEFRNGNAIPLAPELTAYGALLLQWPEGLRSQLQATYLGVRPLTEDRSVKAPSWVTVDLSERYILPVKLPHGRLEAFLFIQNLLNTQWEQATFFFESRLRNEDQRRQRYPFRTGQSAVLSWADSPGISSRPLKMRISPPDPRSDIFHPLDHRFSRNRSQTRLHRLPFSVAVTLTYRNRVRLERTALCGCWN